MDLLTIGWKIFQTRGGRMERPDSLVELAYDVRRDELVSDITMWYLNTVYCKGSRDIS